jgi:hypothetical protein
MFPWFLGCTQHDKRRWFGLKITDSRCRNDAKRYKIGLEDFRFPSWYCEWVGIFGITSVLSSSEQDTLLLIQLCRWLLCVSRKQGKQQVRLWYRHSLPAKWEILVCIRTRHWACSRLTVHLDIALEHKLSIASKHFWCCKVQLPSYKSCRNHLKMRLSVIECSCYETYLTTCLSSTKSSFLNLIWAVHPTFLDVTELY